MRKKSFGVFVFLGFFAFFAFAEATQTSYVSSLLESGELQLETKAQCFEIKRALKEVVSESREVLESKRYNDTVGRPNQWTFLELLQHYFVPNPMVTIDRELFFKDRTSRLARKAFLRLQKHLGNCSNYASDEANH